MPADTGAPGGRPTRRSADRVAAASTRTGDRSSGSSGSSGSSAGSGRRWGSPPPPGWDDVVRGRGEAQPSGRAPRAKAGGTTSERDASPKRPTKPSTARTPSRGGTKTAPKRPPSDRTDATRRAGSGPTRGTGKQAGKGAQKGAQKGGRTAGRSGGRRGGESPARPRRLRRWLLRLTLVGVGLFVLAVGAVAWYIVATPLPAEAPEAQTTFVYDASGEKLASFFNGENRESVPLGRVPKVMQQAVLAAEDRNFYKHGGVDPAGVVRALYQDLRGGGSLQGGSTITQQYVKNAYVGRERTLLRKAKEAVVSLKLERKFTKDEILEKYLNAIYFGRGAYGIQAASQAYFRKDVQGLTLPEASYLAGLIRGPESADARRAPEMAAVRRTRVLTAMVETGAITAAEKRAAEAVPLSGPNGIVAPRPGPGQAYEHTDIGTEYFIDYVRRALIDTYGADRVFGGGLRVKTTLDLDLQRAAYRAVTKTLDRKGDPDAALVSLDRDGRVVAMIGGRDWKTSRVNLAVGRGFGGVGRQGGSSFKPFVLATVLKEGFTAESAFPAPAELTIEGAGENGSDWVVGNDDDHSYPGKINLIDAITHSINTVFAQVVTEPEIGPAKVVATARSLGVTSPLEPVNAIALGAENVSPLEMADAYLTFANRGVRADPFGITEVRTAGGKVLQRNRPARMRVLDSSIADVVNDALQRVVRRGTGTNARVPGVAIAGKTGTTQNYGDAWFVGYTPARCCSTAVWMGYAAGQSIPMDKVHGRRVTGGSFPAIIFERYMAVATKGEGDAEFATVKKYEGELLGSSRRSTGSTGSGSSTRSTKPRSADTVVAVQQPAVTSVSGGEDGSGSSGGDGSGAGSSGGDATATASSPADGGSPTPTAPAQVVPVPTSPPQTVATVPPQTVATVLIPAASVVPTSVPTG